MGFTEVKNSQLGRSYKELEPKSWPNDKFSDLPTRKERKARLPLSRGSMPASIVVNVAIFIIVI